MGFRNVNIIGTGVYHPKKRVGNEFFIKHFDNKDIDIRALLDNLGRKYRYVIDNNKENALTMALEASKDALKSANISPEQLDMIIFSSDTPEYLTPSNALIINKELNANNAHIVYDLNSNCVGMVVALDQASRMMKTNDDIKYCLVCGGLYVSSIAREDCKYTYPASGDAGAALILEAKEEETLRGILDSKYTTVSKYYDTIVSPACGMTKARCNDVGEYEKKQRWRGFHLDFFAPEWAKAIEYFSEKFDFTIDDIELFLLSQYSKQFIIETAKYLNIENYSDKFTYIGDKYGYTGTTSPIVAFHHAIKDKDMPKGSKAVFCSVGAGVAMCSVLYEF
ncbi:ketoacyl-ACP synthase III [Clostridium sp. KNHs214]|uniref:ketoacyl-ACP synthase III n=1 Tax=Clostridium sp. KNHs214 TaxID=1540257 RepID=UPI0005507F73|nr:ketoacyl-ACP synthase III [Clostridium sp. KNHs214]